MSNVKSMRSWYDYAVGATRADVANAGTAYAERLWREDADRRLDIERAFRRHSARGLSGLFASGLKPDGDNVRFNLTKQAVSTLVARVGSSRPRPRCLTTGASYETRQRSKQLQKFLDVLYQVEKVHQVGPRAFRDAALFGTGILRAYGDCNAARVRVERVFPGELLVDQLDSIEGDPSIFVRVKFMTRERLRALAPDHTSHEALKDVPTISTSEMPSSYSMSDSGVVETLGSHCDLVRVYEMHKLGHYDTDGNLVPGRRVLCAGSVLLDHDEYESAEAPYLWFHWCPPIRGFWGESAAAEIRGPEREVNRLLQKVQRSMQLAGQPWVIYEEGSIKAPKITDEPGLMVPVTKGAAYPPSVQAFQPVRPELIQHALTLKAEAFAAIGLNELQVSGTKPAGIESGRGLEQLGEEHSMRFRDVSQAYEQFVAVELASRLVAVARELDAELKAAERGGYKVAGRFGKEAAKVAWADAAIAPEDFTITCWPASILSQTPSARIEEISRLAEEGIISPEDKLRLLEIPDLEAETSIAKADCELLDWQICEMLEKGHRIAPSEAQNLTYALRRGTLALLESVRQGAPMARQDMLRDFLSECEALTQEMASQGGDAAMDPMAQLVGATPSPAAGAQVAMPPGMPPLQ